MAKGMETVMLLSTQKNHIYHLTCRTMVLLIPDITAMLLFCVIWEIKLYDILYFNISRTFYYMAGNRMHTQVAS